jgi:uncharacterized protein YjbI with pentapeptide repeats
MDGVVSGRHHRLRRLRASVRVAWRSQFRVVLNVTLHRSKRELRDALVNYVKADEAVLSWASLRNADIEKSRFKRANLKGAYFWHSDMTRVDLRSANLRRASFRNTNMTRVDLTSADLRRARFGNTNMTRVDLTSADLRGADFTRGDVAGVGTCQPGAPRRESAALRQTRSRDQPDARICSSVASDCDTARTSRHSEVGALAWS